MSKSRVCKEIDFSRQLMIIGKHNQQKLSNSKVLIIGGTSTAIEIAKNLIMVGVKSITLFEDEVRTVRRSDLKINPFLSESDIIARKSVFEASAGI
jgi:ubiquitin-activating enzyme E1